MASPLLSRGSQCTSCVRRVIPFCEEPILSRNGQIRGKKKLAKPSVVKVQLLQNMAGYGRKGSIVPITPGVMRNIWYPKKMAAYMTMAKLAEVKKNDIAVERDYLFASNRERRTAQQASEQAKQLEKIKKEEERVAREAETDQEQGQGNITDIHQPVESVQDEKVMTPDVATSILSRLLPQNIDFFRTPIAVSSTKPAPPPKKVSPSLSSGAALSEAAETAAKQARAKILAAQKPAGPTGIYGAVTTSDVAADLKALLAEDSQGQLVSVTPESISFIGLVEAEKGIKHLGAFEIDIKLDGASTTVRRAINVYAQE